MGYGEATYRDFQVFSQPRIPVIPNTNITKPQLECCFALPVFADLLDDNPLHNDSSQYITWMNLEVNIAFMQFEKYNLSTGLWESQFFIDFDFDAHGVWFPQYGQLGPGPLIDPTFNNLNERLQGYTVDWLTILTDFGEGTYRIKSTSAKTASPLVDTFSPEFCLKQYSPTRANNTVRFEGSITGYRQHLEDESRPVDFSPIKWDFQIRLPNAFYGLNTENLTKEYTVYNDDSRVWTRDETLDKYKLITGMYPDWLHKQLKYWYFKSDNLIVSDFNRSNPSVIIDLPCTRSGPYDPKYSPPNQRAKAEIDFQRGKTTPDSRRC